MVNSKEFSFRLKKIMDFNEISATALAERIGVQRSNISHIISGRNKPSLEFVMKITKAFPEVGLYWLLNGQGTYPQVTDKHSPTPSAVPSSKADIESLSEIPPHPSTADTGVANTAKEIDRIVVFFKDGTFKNYNP